MQAMLLKKIGYTCHECEHTFVGYAGPVVERILCCSHDAGEKLEDVCSFEVQKCHDGYPNHWEPCEDPSWDAHEELWECGNCNAVYGEMADAIGCCK